MKTETETANVLVVDDERDIADLYSMWLGEAYETSVAYDGSEALEYASESTDVVFLDRQMPGLSGDEVLDRLDERGLDCRVVMVTAVDPDFDIVDMPFDDYLTKPVTREDLVETVDEMLHRETYDERLQEYFSAASKKATLETEKNSAELDESDAYAEISGRVERLAEQTDQTAGAVDDFESMFRELPGGS